MKKKILLFILAFAMLFSCFGSLAYADEAAGDNASADDTNCYGMKYVNIASWAELSASSTCWVYAGSAQLQSLVDGDKGTGAGSSHNDNFIERYLTFDEAYEIDKLVIWVNQVPSGSNSVSWDGGLTGIVAEQVANGGQNFNYAVYLEDADGNRIFSQDYNTKDQTEMVIVDSGSLTTPIKKVIIHQQCGWNNNYTFFEVEVFANAVVHNWQLDEATTPATCTEDGEGTYVCSCGESKTDVIKAWGHSATEEWYIEPAVEDDPDTDDDETAPEKHYQLCTNEGCDEKLNYAEHSYKSDCATVCQNCGKGERTTETPHNYTADCAESCFDCGETRETEVDHLYDNDCDTECNECLELREITHTYDNDCDAECNVCKETRTVGEHVYDNDCDADCNVCGTTRTPADHVYDNDCDAECNVCKATRTVGEHEYSDCTDTTCDICGATRAALTHTYDDCTDTTCNTCGATRTALEHVYDNACDADCNTCGATRTPSAHVYDNACADTTCNVCGATRTTLSDHTYGDWTETKAATRKEAGEKTRTCTACSATEKQAIEALGGIGGGAIAGIVVGCVAVVGGGGFCLYWFILKKKH